MNNYIFFYAILLLGLSSSRNRRSIDEPKIILLRACWYFVLWNPRSSSHPCTREYKSTILKRNQIKALRHFHFFPIWSITICLDFNMYWSLTPTKAVRADILDSLSVFWYVLLIFYKYIIPFCFLNVAIFHLFIIFVSANSINWDTLQLIFFLQ